MVMHVEDIELPVSVTRSRFVPGVHIEPCPRWVRASCGGEVVANSKQVLLAYEPRRLPVYWFPAEDVRTDLLSATRQETAPSGIVRWTLQVGDRLVPNAAWSYANPGPERAALIDHIALYWGRMDAWFEEDDEVFAHPRDPYHRVDVLNSSRHVRVELDGQLLAESTRPRLLFETGLPTRYYLPKQDVRMELLTPSTRTSRCPYKGVATYWSLRNGAETGSDIVWSYLAPIPECPKIENLLSFFNERVDIVVDGELQPRPVIDWS